MQNLKLRIRRVVGSKVKLMKICWEIAAIVKRENMQSRMKEFQFQSVQKSESME